ncbi:MAG: hypothetical protein IJX65_00140 [Alistipes sp.]|nr:hypothetical protein [Alistipes sp.]
MFVAAAVSCDKDNQFTGGDIQLDPNKKYIHFESDVYTRGALVEGNVLEDNFNVLGYQYRGDWETAKVLATPNVFDTTPELVTYNAGIYTYETIQQWSGNKYSFFGYYPSNSTNITLFDNGTVKEGEPYIVYTFPQDADPRVHIDVMTADYIDTGVASSASVQMHFRHRLCAVDVGARNYYTLDHDNDTSTDDKLVTIEITGLYVSVTNIVNTVAKIYLDHTKPTEYPNAQTKASLNYEIVGASEWAPDTFDVMPNTASDRAIRLVTHATGENASSLMFIPQEELLSGVVTLYYRKKYVDDDGKTLYQRINFGENNETYYTWTELPTEPNALTYYTFTPALDIDFDKKLIEGRRYYIELTFTSDAVSVNIVAADEWDTKKDVDYEFE